ncbi:MAG: hypothetical protein PHT43_07255 [Anaerolineaceae bacterium]|nr:hypothetical protein [Anaerolineaceae bacterium]
MQKNVAYYAAQVTASVQPPLLYELDDRMVEIIRVQVSRMMKARPFPPHMQDDLVQELSCVINKELPRYNPAKSDVYTFVRMVAFKRSRNCLEYLEAKDRQMNSPDEIFSLDEVINDEQETLGDLINEKSVSALLGKCTRSSYELHDLRDLIRQAMDNMPEEYANICQAILDGETISSLARHFGITRSWFREKYFLPIRKSFLEVGLDQYLVEGLTYA